MSLLLVRETASIGLYMTVSIMLFVIIGCAGAEVDSIPSRRPLMRSGSCGPDVDISLPFSRVVLRRPYAIVSDGKSFSACLSFRWHALLSQFR